MRRSHCLHTRRRHSTALYSVGFVGTIVVRIPRIILLGMVLMDML